MSNISLAQRVQKLVTLCDQRASKTWTIFCWQLS